MHSDRREQSAYKIGIFEKTVISLEEAVLEPTGGKRFVIDSCIARFEFTFEASWKAFKVVLLEKYGIAVNSPKAILAAAYQQELINDEQLWVAMLDDRNQTSHVYDQEIADTIYDHVKNSYFPVLKKTMLMLKESYGSEIPINK